MTLNGVMALTLHYFTEFDSFAGWLHHSGRRQTYNIRIPQISSAWQYLLYLAKTDPCSSRMVSLRQLSFLFLVCVQHSSVGLCRHRQTQSDSFWPVILLA